MTRTESLVGRLSIQDSEWKAGLAKAATQFKQFAASTGKMLSSGISGGFSALKGIGGFLGGIGGQISGLLAQLGGIGSILSAAGIAAGIKSAADFGGELDDMHMRTRIAVEDLVLLREQFKLGGMDAGQVTDVVVKMNKALLDVGKADVFAGLKLDQRDLLSRNPADAVNAVISQVRKLKSLAGQQNVLADIFGKAAGPNMLTLVADVDSFANAKRMVGSMASELNDSAADLATISDGFGGIATKIQQAFVGFTKSLRVPLLEASNWIFDMDFTPVGKKLGDQLMWAFKIFQGMWQNNTFGEFLLLKLENAFLIGVSYFTGIMGAAWKTIFSPRNLELFKTLFRSLTTSIAATLLDVFADFLDGLGKSGKAAGLRNKAGGLREAAGTDFDSATGALPAFAAKTMEDFAKEVASIRPSDDFGQVKENALRMAEIRQWAAAQSRVNPNGPIKGWDDLNPFGNSGEKAAEAIKPLADAATEAARSLTTLSNNRVTGNGESSAGGKGEKVGNKPTSPLLDAEAVARDAMSNYDAAKKATEQAKEYYLSGAASFSDVGKAMSAEAKAKRAAAEAALQLSGEQKRQEAFNQGGGLWGSGRNNLLLGLEKRKAAEEASIAAFGGGGGFMKRGGVITAELGDGATTLYQQQLEALNKIARNTDTQIE